MSGVTVERLPPERRIVGPSAASAGSCCCCCCCCLHTCGSVFGAATGKAPKAPETIPTAVIGSDHAAPKYTVTKEYWATLLILCTIGGPLFVLSEGGGHWDFEEWLLMYAIFMPVVQLATSVVVGIRNAMSKRPGKNERLSHLASITARSFIGGVIGIVAMLLLFGMMK
jgi:hypothetical protein